MLIVPFTAGGPTDTIARLVSIKLHEMWSQPVLIEYKPGAGTVIGVDHVAKSAPDGHAIGVVVSSYSINPVLRRSMPFVRAGKMKVIAVTSEKRTPGFEQFPIVAETFPGFDVAAYLGFIVPSATPRAVVKKIQTDAVKAVNLPDVRA